MAESDNCFYKIVRKGNDAMADLVDPACIATALREYTDMRMLHGLDDAVCLPLHVVQGCVVYPRLTGPDMRKVLLDRRAPGPRETCLQSAMRLLGRLHHGRAAGQPVKDYRREGFLPPTDAVLDRMARRTRTLVVTGFEARNFRYDRYGADWHFFDPHHVWIGYPEEDFARFLISLVMLRGRRGGPRAWTEFDRFGLLAVYETFAPARLDPLLLNYFLHEQLAKRAFYAVRAARRMPVPGRALSLAYTELCYRQLRRALSAQAF